MKITKITQQLKRADRYSIFVDEKYSFSLSESTLLEAGLASGQELSREQVKEFKQLSSDDKLYNMALRYVAMRPRSRWEVEFYLQRKEAPPPLLETILNKLSTIDLINDEEFARTFVNDRRLLRPTSRRKIIMELRKKRVPGEIIETVLSESNEADENPEHTALQAVITTKRRQTKYQDDQKLMQYLARQGFNYSDIKTALHKEE